MRVVWSLSVKIDSVVAARQGWGNIERDGTGNRKLQKYGVIEDSAVEDCATVLVMREYFPEVMGWRPARGHYI